MKKSLHTSEDLGLLIRAVRKSAGVRQDDLAAVAGVSRQFAVDVERGKPTAQVGRILLLLRELGISLTADIPDDAAAELERLQHKRDGGSARSSGHRTAKAP